MVSGIIWGTAVGRLFVPGYCFLIVPVLVSISVGVSVCVAFGALRLAFAVVDVSDAFGIRQGGCQRADLLGDRRQ